MICEWGMSEEVGPLAYHLRGNPAQGAMPQQISEDVHEEPHIGVGGEMLKAGNVITIEPGLYDPEIGGIRIEDLVVVTRSGCENLTTIGKEFVV